MAHCKTASSLSRFIYFFLIARFSMFSQYVHRASVSIVPAINVLAGNTVETLTL